MSDLSTDQARAQARILYALARTLRTIDGVDADLAMDRRRTSRELFLRMLDGIAVLPPKPSEAERLLVLHARHDLEAYLDLPPDYPPPDNVVPLFPQPDDD